MVRLLLGVFFSIISFCSFAEFDCTKINCLAVVDAGSTGSRLHLYTYELDSNNTPVHIQDVWSNKVNPGLANVPPDVTETNRYLANLFKGLPNQNIPIYFYATAGMRMLPELEQEKRYHLISEWLTKHETWPILAMKTITGSEEGAYGWLAMNYHLDRLDTDKTPVAFIEIGGASVQIAMPVSNSSNVHPNDKIKIDVYGKHYELFIHSFLGAGQTEIGKTFENNSACYPEGYEMPNGDIGKGDANICNKSVARWVNNIHQVKAMVRPVLKDNPDMDWYATGGLVYTMVTPIFHSKEYQFTNKTLLKTANEKICQQSWSALKAQYPNDTYLNKYCLLPSYYYALIVKGYGLNKKQPIHYLPLDKNTDWPLGVVLQHKQNTL
jgi:hypothetical protein